MNTITVLCLSAEEDHKVLEALDEICQEQEVLTSVLVSNEERDVLNVGKEVKEVYFCGEISERNKHIISERLTNLVCFSEISQELFDQYFDPWG